MGLTTRNLQNQKEMKDETKNYKFLEFGVDWAILNEIQPFKNPKIH